MLNIYRASAGAGKTHLLTGEYIKLLFRKDLLPESAEHETLFSEILAVTFTNKSTAEMKTRIIEELNKLSQTPTDSDYYKDVRMDGIGGTLTDAQIQQKAQKFLNDILNNYSDFSVSTIDSFFQKIVRNFARELNLQGSYDVELNSERILDAAVSNFLDKLDRPHQQRLFNWMRQFAEKKIEEGAGWKLGDDLKRLVKSTLTSEEFRSRREAVSKITQDKDFLSNYTKMLQEIRASLIKTLKAIGNEGLRILNDADFSPTDFKGKGSSKMRIFEYWSKGTIKEPDDKHEAWAINSDEWYVAKPAKVLPDAPSREIMRLLQEAIALKANNAFVNYHTAKIILDNIFQLGILADIDKEVNEICNVEGTMLLASTTELLNSLINKDEAPFIYEKVGTRIHSFMIDEFQDTSHMQWNNFKPLIENSLGDGRQNLIVGDVKQSIYRWRGSDWGLLHSELKKFVPELSHEDTDTLKTNYRSLSKIIKFNNDFFKYVAEELAEHYDDKNISTIFADVYQEIPEKTEEDNPGSVEIKFLEPADGQKYEDVVAKQLPLSVIQLEDAKFKAKDIAILCRSKKQCKAAADALLKYKSEHPEDTEHVFDVISGEALMLNTREVVKAILSIMRLIQNPDSQIIRLVAGSNYLQQTGMDESEAVRHYLQHGADLQQFLAFSNRPLYDMVEGIISLLPNANKDIAFVQAFRDCVLEFANSKRSDVTAFLEWWDTYCKEKCIDTPDAQNAIRIMTIHKSKGLGMPAVILPFMTGSTEFKGGNIIWCHPEVEPFEAKDLIVPIRCWRNLEKTIFAKDYQEERLRGIIDNINTMYVACTRAKEAMVIYTSVPDSDNVNLQEVLFEKFVGKAEDALFGKLERKKNYNKDEVSEVETITQSNDDFQTFNKIPRLALKHDKLKDIDAIERGNCIHLALSTITDYETIDAPIDALYASGDLTDEYYSCEEMKTEIHRLLSKEDVRDWFCPGLKIFNEHTILGKSQRSKIKQTMHRPDRVIIDGDKAKVIDYKTGAQMKKHSYQVCDYMDFLKEMGFKTVEGYLWYISLGEIDPISSK